MTIEEFAERLNDREYGAEIDHEDEAICKQNNWLVVFGASDDLIEIRGASCDEGGCGDVTTFAFKRNGDFMESSDELIDRCPTEAEILEWAKNRAVAFHITAYWCREVGICWAYETDAPHVTFDILNEEYLGSVYCRGLVIDLNALSEVAVEQVTLPKSALEVCIEYIDMLMLLDKMSGTCRDRDLDHIVEFRDRLQKVIDGED